MTRGNDWRKNMGYDSAEEQPAPLTTNQLAYANGPARGSDRPAASKGDLKPILALWMKDRAEFFGMVSDVGKRIAHTVGWHVWHALPNALRVLWFAPRGLWRVIRAIWVREKGIR